MAQAQRSGGLSQLLPFADRSRSRRVAKVLAWLAGLALVVSLLGLLGIDVAGWFSDLWDTLGEIGLGYLLAGWVLQTVQTTMTALGWCAILRAAFPATPVGYPQVLGAYAAGVAMNGFLPANIGTAVTLLMFVAIIPHATLPGVLGGMIVQKIFFTVAGTFVYAYLFLSVPGSFELQLSGPNDHPVLALAIIGAAGVLLARPRPHLLAQAPRALGQGRPGRRDPREPARLRREGRRCRRSSPGSRSSA